LRFASTWTNGIALALSAALAVALASAKDLPPIKTVGIVSDVGDKVHFQRIGFMAFTNSRAAIDVPDWKIDAFIAAEVEAALKSRYTLSEVDFPRGAIAPDVEEVRLFSTPSPEDNMRANAKPKNGQPIDAYIVVWPVANEVYPTNQRVTGAGILVQGERARVFTAFAVSLLDGSSFKKIDDCWARVRPHEFFGDPDGSYMIEANDLYAESFDAMTPEQKQKLEQGIKTMLHDGIAYCMHDLKLVN
jgi:hypothetical protein